MTLFKIKSLQQRLFLFLLLPVAFLLFALGFFSFLFARDIMLNEWQDASMLKLQRAAHYIDMRIAKPLGWIEKFNDTGSMRESDFIQSWILQQLKQIEGVSSVNLGWNGKTVNSSQMRGMGEGGRIYMRRFHRAQISEITLPVYDAKTDSEVVSLRSDLKDEVDVKKTFDIRVKGITEKLRVYLL